VVFLLPLATLVNHYAYSYYLYPANIGTAIYIAGLFHEFSRRMDGYPVVRRIGVVLPALFSLVLAQQMSAWMAHSNAARWYDDLHNDRVRAIESLKSVLPHPQPDSEIVVAYPRILHLVTYSPSFIRVIFHDLTLTGELFFTEAEAKTYLTKQNDGRIVYLAAWQDDHFVIERSDDPQVHAAAPSPPIVHRLTLRDFGPNEVFKGKPFNVQPDGVSAIWASSVNASSTTVLVINGTELPSVAQSDGRLVTAGVPASVFANSGVFPIYLLDRRTGEKSDEKQFIVK